jgi:hypothetical protein
MGVAVAGVDAPTLFNNHFIMKCNEKKEGLRPRRKDNYIKGILAKEGEMSFWLASDLQTHTMTMTHSSPKSHKHKCRSFNFKTT